MPTVATIEERIEAALVTVRPHLERDSGNVEFIRFEADTGVAVLRFQGACRTCAISALTLRAGIERVLRTAIPEIRRVEAIS